MERLVDCATGMLEENDVVKNMTHLEVVFESLITISLRRSKNTESSPEFYTLRNSVL